MSGADLTRKSRSTICTEQSLAIWCTRSAHTPPQFQPLLTTPRTTPNKSEHSPKDPRTLSNHFVCHRQSPEHSPCISEHSKCNSLPWDPIGVMILKSTNSLNVCTPFPEHVRTSPLCAKLCRTFPRHCPEQCRTRRFPIISLACQDRVPLRTE